MKTKFMRESTYFLLFAIICLVSIFIVMGTWLFIPNPNETGEIILRVVFYIFALLVMMWCLKWWAIYKKQEDDERTNKKS